MDTKIVTLERAKALDEGSGGFSGWASVWNHTDSYGDTVVRGAFADTIPDFLRDGFIPWSHDWANPIAMPTVAREDDFGLYIEASYHSDPTAQMYRSRVAERIAAGKRVGLSIGYEAEAWEMRKVDPPIRGMYGQLTDQQRALTKIKLYETSLVLVPAERTANVQSAKANAARSKAAIASHSTDTSTGAWDGPANEARLNAEDGASVYHRAYAWRDPESDADTKSAYRFIHHEVSDDGAVGAANIRACQSGIGVLNGGRGGTSIPDADRAGVHRHLARHLEDADLEAPPLKAHDADNGETFAAHSDRVLDDVRTYLQRATDIHALRVKAGRELSEANRQRLQELLEALGGLDPLRESLSEWLASTAPKPKDEDDEPEPEKARGVRSEALRLREEHARTLARITREFRERIAS